MRAKAKGFVYAVGWAWGEPVKIGVAANVARRLERLQSGNHVTLSVLWQSALLDDPFAIEAQLHNAYRAHNVRGEWFHVPDLNAEALSAAVEGAHVAVRMLPEPDEASKAAASACAFLLDRLRREGLPIEDAIGSLASSSGLGRSTIWALRYRPPSQIMITPYASIVAELWRVMGQPPFDSGTIPPAEDVLAVLRGENAPPRKPPRDLQKLTALTGKLAAAISEAEAALGNSINTTQTQGEAE
jgi:hypothetical protein